jgi:PhoPQ-activated pathogenicity-related protein
MAPNQPLVLHHDGVPRKEDDFIAYTWDQFLKTGDETWPARLPMVKSAVRAMDCVQELLASDQGGRVPIEKFVVAGGSKRGWTTWCTAAVDQRVAAIIPVVVDVVNVPAC